MKSDRDYTYFGATKSMCRECRELINAQIHLHKDGVFMRKYCPKHKHSEVLIAKSVEWFLKAVNSPQVSNYPKRLATNLTKGCPYDCGLCQWHEKACNLPVFSITNACNMNCPICFTYNRKDRLYFSVTIQNMTYTGQGDIQTKALDGISLDINEGDFIAVTGPSGSGKTTLLHLLGLLESPSFGSIILDGEDAGKMQDRLKAEWRLKKIGFVFQSFNLISYLTALENTIIPYWRAGNTKKKSLELGKELLCKMGLEHRLHHSAGAMSAGEQQRVAIARAVINSPSILLADEPTGNLDSKNSNEIMELFTSLNKNGQTIIKITHEQEYASKAHQIIVLRDGKIYDG